MRIKYSIFQKIKRIMMQTTIDIYSFHYKTYLNYILSIKFNSPEL